MLKYKKPSRADWARGIEKMTEEWRKQPSRFKGVKQKGDKK